MNITVNLTKEISNKTKYLCYLKYVYKQKTKMFEMKMTNHIFFRMDNANSPHLATGLTLKQFWLKIKY